MLFRYRQMSVRIAHAFKKKPVTIEAVQITEPQFVDTLEGRMKGNPGDWLVTGVEGEQYFVAHDIFPKTFEPLDAGAKDAWSKAYGAV